MIELIALKDLPISTRNSKEKLYNLIYECAKELEIELLTYGELKVHERVSNELLYAYLRKELDNNLPSWNSLNMKTRLNFSLLYEVVRTGKDPIFINYVIETIEEGTSEPIANVQLKLKEYPHTTERMGVTDENGIYQYENLKLDSLYTLTCIHDEYIPHNREFVANESQKLTIELEKKKLIKNNHIIVKDDMRSEPIPSAFVKLNRIDDINSEDPIVEGLTDNEGKLELPELYSDLYKLEVSYPSENYFNTYKSDIIIEEDDKDFETVLDWHKIEDVNIKVKDSETGEFLDDVYVTLQNKLPDGMPNINFIGITLNSNLHFSKICNIPYHVKLDKEEYDSKEFDYNFENKDVIFSIDFKQVETNAKVEVYDYETQELINSDCTVLFENGETVIHAEKIEKGIYQPETINSGYYDIHITPNDETYEEFVLKEQLVSSVPEKNVFKAYITHKGSTVENVKIEAYNDIIERITDVDIKLINENSEIPVLTPSRIVDEQFVFDEVPTGNYTIKITNSDEKYEESEQTGIPIHENGQLIIVRVDRAFCEDLDLEVDDKNGNPITNALITIKKDDEIVEEVSTDNTTGIAHIEKIRRGTYDFSIKKGLDEIIYTREVTADTDNIKFLFDFDIAHLVRFILINKDLDGERVDNATVTLTNDYGSYAATPHEYDTGLYIFNEIPTGLYTLKIISTNTEDYIIENKQIDDGSPVETIELSLKRPRKIPIYKVNVHNKYGDSISRAENTLLSKVTPFTDSFTHNSDINGETIFNNEIYIGNWNLTTNHRDYNQLTENLEASIENPEHNIIMVEKEPLPIPHYTINVVNEIGEPLNNAEVIFTNIESEEEHTGVTNDDGQLIWTDTDSPLFCGFYNVKIKHNNYAEYIKNNITCSFKNNTLFVSLQKVIEEFKVLVHDEFGWTVEDATVNLKNKDNEMEYSVKTDSKGEAVYTNILSIGTYNLSIYKEVLKPYNKENVMLDENTEDLTVNVQHEARENNRIYLQFFEKTPNDEIFVKNIHYVLENLTGTKIEGTIENGVLIKENLEDGYYSLKLMHEDFKPFNTAFTLKNQEYINFYYLNRKMAKIYVTPTDMTSSYPVKSDTLTLTDLDGTVWVDNQTLPDDETSYEVTVPLKKLIPFFTGRFFDTDNPSDWMGPDEFINVDEDKEGFNFVFRVRPIPYVRVQPKSALDGSVVPCNIQIMDSTGNEKFNGAVTTDTGLVKYILPISRALNDNCLINCTSLTGYDAIRPKEVRELVVSQEETNRFPIELVKIVTSMSIEFRYADSYEAVRGPIHFTILDSTGLLHTFDGLVTPGGYYLFVVDGSFDLPFGQATVNAEACDNTGKVRATGSGTFDFKNSTAMYRVSLNKI